MSVKRFCGYGLAHWPALRLGVALVLLALAQTVRAIGPETPPNRPYADMKLWHLGFGVGLHSQDFHFTHSGAVGADGKDWRMDVPGISPGFNVCVLGDLRLHENINLRLSPGILFGSTTIVMREQLTGDEQRQTLRSAYVSVPLDVKLSGWRMRNVRPYVTGGVMGAFRIGRQRSEALQLTGGDAYLTVGIGCDFYLPYFKLIPELKFCFGLTDVLRHDRPDLADDPASLAPTGALRKVKGGAVMLTFYFE